MYLKLPKNRGVRCNNNMSENGEFEIVIRRKRGKRFRSVISNQEKFEKEVEPDIDFDQFTRKLNAAKDELNASEYVKSVFQHLKECKEILNSPNINDVVCYGLGHFSERKHSKYQLALLLILRDYFLANVYVYDPLFFADEIGYLKSINFNVITENEEGKRKVESTTLIYFPHCPKQLTNNFLYANWSPDLKHCILFSNSFRQILESHTNAVLNNSARYIARINPFVKEIELPNNFKYETIFNDSALHIFIPENLKDIPKSFWDDKEEPRYLEKDIEFIAKSIAQTLML